MFFGKIKRFLRDRIASIAPIFAVMAVPIILVAGAATDVTRHHNANEHVQMALDAAGLAAAREARLNPNTSNAELVAIAQSYFDAQLASEAELSMKKIQLKQAGADIKLSVKGEVPTSFMRIIGRQSMPLETLSQVTSSVTATVEVALVLDLSDSMAGKRLSDLQNAATNFVDSLVDPSSDQSKVSIVPFGTYINVGIANRKASWISVPADVTKHEKKCSTDFSSCGEKWGICHTDGVLHSCRVPDCSGLDLKKSCAYVMASEMWYGCVLSRKGDRDISDEGYDAHPIEGYLDKSAQSCASEIVPLSNDRDTLKTKIAGLTTHGNTYIPAGLMWGFRTLSDQEPFDQGRSPAELAKSGGKKAVVLMSDGENSFYRSWHTGKHYANFTHPKGKSAGKKRMEAACDFIKGSDVEIYTIAFDIKSKNARDQLLACASSNLHYFEADNAKELFKVFQGIANSFERELAVSA